jgi:glyoxylase-like metal-dependent hydrolase (beta-lactamase superfamily II)
LWAADITCVATHLVKAWTERHGAIVLPPQRLVKERCRPDNARNVGAESIARRPPHRVRPGAGQDRGVALAPRLFALEETMPSLPRSRRAAACLVTLLICTGAIAAAQAPAPAPYQREGATVKLSEHVYVIPDFKVGMVPNVGIVVGTKGALVIDPGMGWRNGEVVLREVQKVSAGGDLYIVNTHFHPEHTTGEVAFPASAKVLRAAAQQQDVDEMGLTWVENFAKRSPEIGALLKDVTFRKPAQVFDRETALDLGGVRVRIMWLGPGHTRGDTVMFVEEDRVLFAGDLTMKGLFPAFASPQSRSDTWLVALDEMDRLKPRVVVGAHYDNGDASDIEAYRGYLKALRARAAELKKDGKSADEAGKILVDEFKAKYPGWAQPARVTAGVATVYRELP